MAWLGLGRSVVSVGCLALAVGIVGSSSGGCSNPCGGGCGTCSQTIEQFCDSGESCTFSGRECGYEGVYLHETEVGCGHIRVTVSGPETEYAEWIYDEESLELVFVQEVDGSGDPCDHATIAGTSPECSTWTPVCDDADGLGGAAGAGP
jgi:hypothetical protein